MNTTSLPLLGNRYHLFNLLGAGGMGSVYRTLDRLTGETVALKRVTTSAMQPVSSPELRLALAHEFQALASLRHPHIIAVRDYGFDAEQQPYFTMELLPHSRSIVAAGQSQSMKEKVHLLLQLLYALAYLHRRGIVHRDLKPGNILVVGREVKVLDFGLAAMAGQVATTSGTLLYMAPEVMRGEPAEPASDLYAVGVIGYELFAGWHPFANAPQGLIAAVLTQPPDWSFVDIPLALQDVFDRLLAKRPNERYEDVTAVIAALSQAIGEPLPPETAATRESFLQAAPFVGREAELEQLTSALSRSQTGQGSAWLLTGESGVGKSRLLNELRTRALVQGVAVLRGQASESDSAFHLWRDVLRWLALLATPNNLEAAVLQTLLPDIPQLLERDIPQLPALAAEQARKRLFSTVTALLRRASHRQPLLLLLEDLHWIDDDSLELLGWLNRLVAQSPILIIASYRRGERPDLPLQLPEMQGMAIGRLPQESVAALSEAMLGQGGKRPKLVAFLQRETEGNTFFLVEVMRALAEEVGQLDRIAEMTLPAHVFAGGMKQVVQRRLERIPLLYRPLLQRAAIAGRRLDLTLLATLAEGVDLEAWLTTGANTAVLEVQDGRWQFAHDKLREGILVGLAAGEKQILHCQVAQAIEQVYNSQLPSHYADLAYHYGQAQERDLERHYLQLAAETAQITYANAAAIEFYQRLLPLLEPEAQQMDVLLKLGTVLKLVGKWEDAEVCYRQALEQANLLDGTAQARCAYALGSLSRSRGEFRDGLTWLEQAKTQLTALGDVPDLVDVLIEIGNSLYFLGEYPVATEQLESALTLATQLGDKRRMASALHNLGNVAFDQGNYPTTRQHYEKSLELGREIGDKSQIASSLNNLGILASYQGDPTTTEKFYTEGLKLRREIGDVMGIAASLNNLGIVAKERHDYERATALYQESLAVQRELGNKHGSSFPLNNLGAIAFERGEYAQARQLYEETLALRRSVGDRWGTASVLSSLGDTAVTQGDYPAARRFYIESLDMYREIGDKQKIVYGLVGMAAIAVREANGANRAAYLLTAVQGLLREFNLGMESNNQALYEQTLTAVQTILGEKWQKRPMTLEQAIDYALHQTTADD